MIVVSRVAIAEKKLLLPDLKRPEKTYERTEKYNYYIIIEPECIKTLFQNCMEKYNNDISTYSLMFARYPTV